MKAMLAPAPREAPKRTSPASRQPGVLSLERGRLPLTVLAALVALLGAVDARANRNQLEVSTAPVSLRGEVVETGCFVIGDRHGEKHRQCAIACARAGQDLGILDAQTGILYVEIRNQEEGPVPSLLIDHVARQVEVRGQILAAGGVQGVAINRVRALD